jgi:hypothetical protein
MGGDWYTPQLVYGVSFTPEEVCAIIKDHLQRGTITNDEHSNIVDDYGDDMDRCALAEELKLIIEKVSPKILLFCHVEPFTMEASSRWEYTGIPLEMCSFLVGIEVDESAISPTYIQELEARMKQSFEDLHDALKPHPVSPAEYIVCI